jgi:AraC-like DNA-binding protein
MSAAGEYRDVFLRYVKTEELTLEGGLWIELPERRYPKFAMIKKETVTVTLDLEDGRRTGPIHAGELVYIPPYCRCTIHNDESRAARVAMIRFQVERRGRAVPEGLQPYPLAGKGDSLSGFRVPQSVTWIPDFTSGDPNAEVEPAVYYRLQSHLYAIASAFAAYAGDAEKPGGADDELIDYVERTKQHMLDRYSEPADMEQLARLSGASSSRFYELFRRQTGFSPHKFITTVRLNESLRLLANSRIPVMDVAHSVGYADELYFSRLFKKHMGMSPTEYAACAQKRIVIPPVFAGDISVLGIMPELVLDRGWSEAPDTGPYIEQIRASHPELILTSPITEELRTTLSSIAPVISLAWKENSWRDRLLQISDVLDISTVAKRWLAFYDIKVENARFHVRRTFGETPYLLASTFGVRFRVYGKRTSKIKDLFYDDLQVAAPGAAGDIGMLEPATFDEIANIDADNLLFLAPESWPADRCAQLEERWRKLKGNRTDTRCLIVRCKSPLMYNAATYESIIDRLVGQFLQ